MPPLAGAGAGERLPRLRAPDAAAPPDRAAGTGNRPARSTIHSTSGACAAAQSSPARMPASGPAKSGTSSATTGSPVSAKRAGSPLALRMSRVALRREAFEHARQDGRAADLVSAPCRRRPCGAPARRRARGRESFESRAVPRVTSPLEGEVDRHKARSGGGWIRMTRLRRAPPSPTLPLKGGGSALDVGHAFNQSSCTAALRRCLALSSST